MLVAPVPLATALLLNAVGVPFVVSCTVNVIVADAPTAKLCVAASKLVFVFPLKPAFTVSVELAGAVSIV